MRIGDKIKVDCTDTGKSVESIIHRISKDWIDVVVGANVVIRLNKRPNTSLYIGNNAGMEFTTRIIENNPTQLKNRASR